MDLGGPWRVHPANDDLRRSYQDPGHDDRAWLELDVPSHWRSHRDLADFDGSLLYRRAFQLAAGASGAGERWWLWLDGVFYQGDVWLDGAYVGDTEGYFFGHGFDVTDLVGAQTEHLLAVEVASAAAEDAAGRALVGAFANRDFVTDRSNPGGLWRPVRLARTGPVAIRHGRLRCTEASDERAILALRLVLDARGGQSVTLRTRIGGVEHRLERALAHGENRVEWTVAIARPDRWWPRALGAAVLHDVAVDVLLGTADDPDDSGELGDLGAARAVSDSRRWRTGLRTIELKNWKWRINGEQLFVKGANIGPVSDLPGAATVSELRADLVAAAGAGLDGLRVHTHIARPEFYDAADELGLLLWQDLPLQGRYPRGVRKQALRQCREAVDLLAHHPAVAVWCAHNEPYSSADDRLPPAAARQGFGRRAMRRALPQQLPSWNRSLLDASLRVALDRNDGTRPVIAHSGVAPHLPQLDGTDAHLWFGWYEGDVDELADLAATMPRIVRCVSEFGAQAVPSSDDFLDPAAWPDLDWERIVGEFGAQTAVFDQRISPDDYATFAEWRDATQCYQAQVVRRTIEILRRLKYRPAGSFFAYKLADTRPAVGFGLIDHERRAKLALPALAEVCRPVIAIADLPDRLERGARVDTVVHVVSDLRRDLLGAVARAELDRGSRSWAWSGDVPADSCTMVGRLGFDAPAEPGPLSLTLEVEHPSLGVVRRRYDTTVR